jgi:hypothetical protein
MTEQEWMQATDPRPMLKFLRGKTSERKLRLFACAWAWDYWSRMHDERSRGAFITAERFADKLADLSALHAAYADAWEALRKADTSWAAGAAWAAWAASYERYDIDSAIAQIEYQTARISWPLGASRLRCLFGNPFRPITLNPVWLIWHGGLLVSMAQKMYDSHDFTDMPVLADALEEAGCQDQDILGHCRSGGEHVRGCWVVD